MSFISFFCVQGRRWTSHFNTCIFCLIRERMGFEMKSALRYSHIYHRWYHIKWCYQRGTCIYLFQSYPPTHTQAQASECNLISVIFPNLCKKIVCLVYSHSLVHSNRIVSERKKKNEWKPFLNKTDQQRIEDDYEINLSLLSIIKRSLKP